MAIAPIITEKIVDLSNNTNYCFEVAPQGDGRSRFVKIILLENGVAYNIPNDTAIIIIEGENAGGYNIYNECSYNGNVITIPLSKGLLSYAGLGKYQISIYGSDNIAITSFKFNLFVTECPYDVIDLQASDSYEALSNLVNKANDIIYNGGSSSGGIINGNINKWIVGEGKPSLSISDINENDYYLNSLNGNIYKYESNDWTFTNYNIKEKIYIKYSNNIDGTDFDDISTGKSYMGICNSIENTAPLDKTKYKWSLITNGIRDIVQTVISDEDNGINKIQCTLEDGTTLTPWEIKNGGQGTAAGFGTPTYNNENSNGSGNAEVIVTAHGLDTEKIFNFEFRNIKGEQGDRGEQGLQGIQGEPGLRGTIWNTGTSITGTSTIPTIYSTNIENALIGDLYLNTDTSNFYKCTYSGNDTEAKWVYMGSIVSDGEYELPIASNTILGGIKVDGTTITINEDGVISAELEENIDTNTTYTLKQNENDNNQLIFTSSDGDITTIELPNNISYNLATSSTDGLMSSEDKVKLDSISNTTYTLSQDPDNGHKITLTPSEGTPTTITIPDNNTEYEKASTTELGLVKVDGTSITIDENGVISSTSNSEGTSDYSNLENKPSINGIELNGEKSLEDLGIIIPSTEGFVKDSNYVHTDNNFTNEYKTKLDGLENSDDYVLPVASSSTLGGVKIDNDTIIIDKDGVISAKTTGTSEEISNYSELSNKPSINNVELSGNKTLDDLGIAPADDYVIDEYYIHTDNNFTTEEKNKLAGLGSGGDYVLPIASSSNLGGVKVDNDTITIDKNGIISSTHATSLVLTDDTTGVKYKIGIDNGKFYMEEVNNG